MHIFISYSFSSLKFAENIYQKLVNRGYSAFFDKSKLQPGTEYDNKIHIEIEKSHLMIFLITADAIEKNSYCLTELKWFQEKFPSAINHLIPILISEVEQEIIPSYLSSTTYFQTDGDIPAELVKFINEKYKKHSYSSIYVISLLIFVTVVLATAILVINKLNSPNSQLISYEQDSISSEEAQEIQSKIEKWNIALNRKNLPDLSTLYSKSVLLYGVQLDRQQVIKKFADVLMKNPQYFQIIIEKPILSHITSNSIKATFSKRSSFNPSNSPIKTYPCYFVFEKENDNSWMIATEGDYITDINLENMKNK